MYLTMNRFRVRPGREADFEAVWTARDSQLPQVPGFVSFHLLKGGRKDDHVLYLSHTVWTGEQAFTAWTKSEAFRAAHRGAGGHADIYLEAHVSCDRGGGRLDEGAAVGFGDGGCDCGLTDAVSATKSEAHGLFHVAAH